MIFGAGFVGNDYQRQLNATNYCTTITFIDNKITEAPQNYDAIREIGIRGPNAIIETPPDYIVVATLREDARTKITAQLKELGVPEAKIIGETHTLLSSSVHSGGPTSKNQEAWNSFYEHAEASAAQVFARYLEPIIARYAGIDVSHVLDFACGRGRIAALFSRYAKALTCCDANKDAVEYCKKRFGEVYGKCRMNFAVNEVHGYELTPLPFQEDNFSFIYSWDSMVHFEYRWLDWYISEFYRILIPGGFALVHHSNYAAAPSSGPKMTYFEDNPGWRTLVSANDVRFIAQKHGFEIEEQNVIDWGMPDLDCISLLRKR